MMLGETEFRHQIETSIRPFRDVLLGLFFIGIGMRFDPAAIPPIWHWATLGALLIMASKTLIVTAMIRRTETDPVVAREGALGDGEERRGDGEERDGRRGRRVGGRDDRHDRRRRRFG